MTPTSSVRSWLAFRLVLGILSTAVSVSAAHIDARLTYLPHLGDKSVGEFAGSVRFHEPPSAAVLAELADEGIAFSPYHSRTVYPARVPMAALSELAEHPAVAAVACAWRHRIQPALYDYVPEVEADLAHEIASPLGGTLSGRGVTVVDVDTGVMTDHMALFHLGEERFAWNDNDGSGDLTAGDTVDLDGNGQPGADERLWFKDTLGFWGRGNVFGQFDPKWDLAFHDADGDGVRDIHEGADGELVPSHGEQLFVVDDLDGDGVFGPADQLRSLGLSKVRAVREADGRVYRRGEDLFQAPGDYWPHGTYVSGIIAGGWAGYHAMSGVAPGVDLLHVVVRYNDAPPLLAVSLEEHVAWAVSEGAQVVNIEDSEWVWEYMDGSSNLEIMMNELAVDPGVIFVAAAGNMDTGMHCLFASSDGQTLTISEGATRSWPTFLWTEDVEFTVQVTTPSGVTVDLPLDGGSVTVAGYAIYGRHSVSPRGTHRLDVALATSWEGGLILGEWGLRFWGPDTPVHGYIGDDVSGWTSASTWGHGAVRSHNVPSPATADSCITVGAKAHFSPPGTPAFFSSVGPRIDGQPVVDILAPGIYVYCADPVRWNGYFPFSGTSAATPFVAGAAAILKELDPELDHGRCRDYIRRGALHPAVDPLTGGAGDLSVMGAVSMLLDDLADEPPPRSLAIASFPNPFNSGTTVRFRQLARGTARIRVFDLRGREVWHHDVPSGPAGWREVRWNGSDQSGQSVASGTYLAHVESAGRVAVQKLALVR